MTKPYKVISDYHPSAMYAAEMAKVPAATQQSVPGWAIMNQPNAAAAPNVVFQRLVQWAGANCRWHGSDPRGSGQKLLDGDETQGQCALFASALRLLFTAPAPFGLGLQATLETWNGRYGKGFVVAHNGAFIGLTANVQGQNLYLWGNHKVVRCNGQLWDAAYGNPNTQPDDVILYHIMDNEVQHGGATWYPAEATARAAGTVVGGRPVAAGQGVFFKLQGGVYTGPFLAIQ